jgi:cyclic pyranopterin phosphate synthase
MNIMEKDELTHIDQSGNAQMVDVSLKSITHREALARSQVYTNAGTIKLITDQEIPKGDVFAAARVAGIMAAKKTPELIPLCHQLALGKVTIDFQIQPENSMIEITAKVTCDGKTGVEMEALTAAAVSALTIYDMIKAVDKTATISNICLIAKSGGKSGIFNRSEL